MNNKAIKENLSFTHFTYQVYGMVEQKCQARGKGVISAWCSLLQGLWTDGWKRDGDGGDLATFDFQSRERERASLAALPHSVRGFTCLRKNSYSSALPFPTSAAVQICGPATSLSHARVSLDRVRSPCMGKTTPHFFPRPPFAVDDKYRKLHLQTGQLWVYDACHFSFLTLSRAQPQLLIGKLTFEATILSRQSNYDPLRATVCYEFNRML